MTITVELHRSNLATVYTTPSLLRRIMLREETTERNACRVLDFNGGYFWVWDASGRRVDEETQIAIDCAVARATRDRIARAGSGIQPPS